jgi:UDP-N-acetylmuramyl pentapeptide phosphotransferase/UDP-N-acetylglucosamine-1-phosphate transferase
MPAELAKPSKRGLHDIDTPTSAGIALFFGFSIALIYNTQNISPILIILAVMLIVGFLDDKNKAPKLFRFITQIFISMASIYFIGGSSLHPLIFILYTFFMTYFINAYNFMDGIDSILTSQTLFCLISLLALVSTSSPWLPSMQIMISVLLVFMIFNYHPSKLFLGNSGSYFLGTYIAILIIGLHLLKEVNILTSIIILTTSIADTAYAIVSRFLNKLTVLYNQKKSLKNILIISIKHVFNTAHCTHNYQKLAIKFRNHTKSVIVIMLYNLLWCLPLAIMSTINTSYSVLCLLASYTPYIVWCYKNKTGVEEN